MPCRKTPRRRSRAEEKQVSGLFPRYLLPLPLAMSTCGEVGSDVHALIKDLAIRRVEHRWEKHSNESQHPAEGAEVARLRQRFSFVLLQALSFRTRHHLCTQGVALASTRKLRSQGPASVQTHRIEGVTESEGQEGANVVGGGIGVGGGNGDGNRVGGGNGDMNSHGDGDGAGGETGTGVEVDEGAQDGSRNGDGNGDGVGTGTGVETRRRTPDGNGDGNGDGSETVVEMGTGTRVTGTGTRTGSGRAEERRRSARNRKIVVDAMWETGET